MLRCWISGSLVSRRLSAMIFARGDHMTPPVKENIDAAYVNCIEELKELKIYKSADEEIDETLNRYHFPNSIRKHVYNRSILPSIKAKVYISKILKKMENEHLKQISDITIDPVNRYREEYFK